MNNQTKTQAEELAEEHWAWICGLLSSMGRTKITIKFIRYVYVTAFIHGFKHGQEESQREEMSEHQRQAIRKAMAQRGIPNDSGVLGGKF